MPPLPPPVFLAVETYPRRVLRESHIEFSVSSLLCPSGSEYMTSQGTSPVALSNVAFREDQTGASGLYRLRAQGIEAC